MKLEIDCYFDPDTVWLGEINRQSLKLKRSISVFPASTTQLECALWHGVDSKSGITLTLDIAGKRLMGINSQILSPSGGSIGLGFSIPTNMARSVLDQLTTTGKVRRGQLSIIIQKVSTDIASSLDFKEARGVIISQVQPVSAAERAGLKQGDIITALNGVAVDTPNSFRNQIAGTPPGTEVKLTVLRDSKSRR